MRQVEQEQRHEKNTLPKDAAQPSKQTNISAQHRSKRSTQGILLLFTLGSSLWHRLRLLFQKIYWKQVPEIRQMTEAECGLACLAMILSYYGRKTSISELRTHYGVGRDGISALGIVRAARIYGLRVRAVSLQQNDFRFVKLPAIVHWEFNHFLIVERWSRGYVDVVDPARGKYRLTYDEFDAGFTGVVLTFEPSGTFDRRSAPAARTFREFVLQYFRQAPGTILQLLGASLLLELFGLILPLVTKVVIDQILPFKMSSVIGVLGLGILILFLSQTITTLMRGWLLVYLQTRIDIHMMLGFVERLLSLPYSFFEQRSSGDLLTRLASNTTLRDILSNQLLSTLLDSSLVIFYLFILLWQSLPFALLTLAIGVIQILLLLGSNRPIRNLASRELAAQGKSQGYLTEALTGIATLKGSGAEQRAFERWSNLFFDQLNISLRYNYLSATLTTIMNAVRSLAPLALLWVGAIQVLNGSLTLGTMIALSALAGAFLSPLAAVVGSGQQLQLVGAHLERIADVTEAEPEQKGQAARPTPQLTGNIHLENVGFRYASEAPVVLQGLDLTVEAGQKLAIVGPSGSGKSTLGKLLLGLYVPTEGRILYDDIPLQQLNYQEVRQQFGVVLQEASLFSGSIFSNITLNDPAIDKEQVAEAATIAAIHDDIMNMPMGYETLVAEGGSALSGGQRQRLAIARAIAHKPALLLLDEATSHLDVATEKRVAQHLQALACTQIIIAHRLSTIRDADVILVLYQGMIVERGSHDELLQRNGYYAQLMRQQLERSNTILTEEAIHTDAEDRALMEQATERRQIALPKETLLPITKSKAQAAGPATAPMSSPAAPEPEAQTPVTIQTPIHSNKQKMKRPAMTLLVVAIALLSSVLGTTLWLFPATHHTVTTVLPTATKQPELTTTATPSSSTPVLLPTIANQYNGTIGDLSGHITTKMILSNIQQKQGVISGYFGSIPDNNLFNGVPQNGPFTGTITASKKVYFIVTSDTGNMHFSFNGQMQADGSMAGTYCSLGNASGKCSTYGIWSVAPVK